MNIYAHELCKLRKRATTDISIICDTTWSMIHNGQKSLLLVST